jgi:hypothetical protein
MQLLILLPVQGICLKLYTCLQEHGLGHCPELEWILSEKIVFCDLIKFLVKSFACSL